MSVKRWIKSPGKPVSLSESYRETLAVGDFKVDIASFANTPTSRAALGQQWSQLEALAEPSVFLSWGWQRSWLEVLVEPDATLLRIEVRQGDELVGLALAPLCQRGAGPLRSRTAFLNELPLAGRDMTLEKNGLLARVGFEPAVFSAAIGALARSALAIDEIRVNGVDQRYLSAWQDVAVAAVATDELRCCWLLGRRAGDAPLRFDAWLAQLSSSRRWQITRFQRLAEEQGGPVRCEVATDLETAERWFERLAELHTAYWQRQGKPGVFGNPWWRRFHWRLIEQLLPTGQVQLARIRAGEIELGYLYNLRQGAEMVNIQSGFAYREDNRWRPGYLAHLLAADAAEHQGCSTYDLLMGDDGYKSSIARPGAQLHWLQIFPRRLVNQRLLAWRALELYRRLRTSSRPNAQGELKS